MLNLEFNRPNHWLRPWRTGEQEHVSLSNAILHNSAVRTKHTHTHVRLYFVNFLVVQWVVIDQYAMGRSLMDRPILNISLLSPCFYICVHYNSFHCDTFWMMWHFVHINEECFLFILSLLDSFQGNSTSLIMETFSLIHVIHVCWILNLILNISLLSPCFYIFVYCHSFHNDAFWMMWMKNVFYPSCHCWIYFQVNSTSQMT